MIFSSSCFADYSRSTHALSQKKLFKKSQNKVIKLDGFFSFFSQSIGFKWKRNRYEIKLAETISNSLKFIFLLLQHSSMLHHLFHLHSFVLRRLHTLNPSLNIDGVYSTKKNLFIVSLIFNFFLHFKSQTISIVIALSVVDLVALSSELKNISIQGEHCSFVSFPWFFCASVKRHLEKSLHFQIAYGSAGKRNADRHHVKSSLNRHLSFNFLKWKRSCLTEV